MNNSTKQPSGKLVAFIISTVIFSLSFFVAGAQAVYTTAVADWTQSWDNNSGAYQATGGPGLYSFGTTNTEGQVNTRLLTSDGTTSGAQQALRVGQKLIIRMAAPVGGGRSNIQTGGRIGFALKSSTGLFDGSGGFGRYNANALMRVEYQGGLLNAQIVDGSGTTQSGMPNFADFVAGQTYEVEMISDKEYNLQLGSGMRYNIRSMTATSTVKQITIANLGENRDGVYTLLEVANTPTVSVVANGVESYTVTGVISNNGVTANTLTKTGTGTVTLTGQNTYTGLTTVSNGTLRLNAASANTINPGNNITLASGGTLQVSQDQTVGNLVVPAGSTLQVDAGKTLTITGTFTGGGTIINNGTISMSGTAAQSFPGSGSISAMNNLTINNSSVNGVTLDAALLTVTGTLNFAANGGLKSLLTTGSNVIVANTVTGASAVNGWVNGNLQKNIATPGIRIFEVGDVSNYTPGSLNIAASGFTAGSLRLSTRAGITTASGFGTLSLLSTDCINRVWSLTIPSGSTFTGNYSGTFNYVPGDVLGSPTIISLRTGIYIGSMWRYFVTLSALPMQVTTAAGIIPMPTNDIVFAMPKPVTISGVLVTPKMYDAGTGATLDFSTAVINGINPWNFVTISTTFATGTFADKHAGTGKPVTIINTSLSSPGLDANAYVLSAQPTASGDITQRPLTVTAVSNTKTYDGNTSAAAIPIITPAGPTGLQGADVAAFTETYDTKNAGTNKVLTPAGLVNDGNSGNNYAYTFVNDNTGIINNIPITNLTATPGSIVCNGGTTTLTVSASGGDGALEYSLTGTATFPYQSSPVFTGVGAGTYTLTVKDEDNFTEQLPGIVIGQPGLLSGTITKNNVSACVAANGSITVTPSGGSGVYNYSWTGLTGLGATTPYTAGNVSTISGLDIGYYNVTITDANGCGVETISNIHIQYAFSVVVTNSGSTTSACGNNGTIILYGNAGVQPYTYSIDGTTYQSSNLFTGMAAGTYTGYIKDAAGCVGTKPNIVIAAAAPIVVNPFVRNASSCGNDGSIEIYRTGGIPPYSYSLDGVTYQASNVFSGLAAGAYTAYVKDSKDCVGSASATVGQGAALSLSILKTNTSTCTNDGTIRITVSGGIAPFTYSLDGISYQSSNLFAGLAAGSYTAYAKDSKGCTGQTNVTLNLNTIIVTSYVVQGSSCVSNNGSIQLFRTGGVGPYTYSLDGNTYQSSTIFSNLAPGTYDGYVKDSKGCIGLQSGIVINGECLPPLAQGVFTKTKVNAVPSTESGMLDVQVFPNPSATSFLLRMHGYNDEKLMVKVTDMAGRIVYQAVGNGKQLFSFGDNFNAGIYVLQVTQGKRKQQVKIIKE